MPQRMVGILVRRIERIKRKTGRFAQLKNHNEGATGKNKKGNDKMEKDQPTAYNKLIRYQLEAQRVLHEYFMGTEEKAKNFYANLELIGVIKNLEIVINTQNVQINNIETMVEKQQKKLENVLDNITLTTTQQRESPPEERK